MKPLPATLCLASLGLFMAVMENYEAIKIIGLFLLLLTALLEAHQKHYRASRKRLTRLSVLTIPIAATIALSTPCLGTTALINTNILLKALILGSLVLFCRPEILAKAIGFSITVHIAIWITHWIFLFSGNKEFFDTLIQLDAQVQFGGVPYIPFRATGLFDEPSLFAMTILGLLIARFFISGTIPFNIAPVLSLSTPAILAASLARVIASKRRQLLILIPLALALLALLVVIVNQREENLKFSPIQLRLTHAIALIESDNLLKGNGICQAYGRYDFYLDRDELRQLNMGNYKDAGQVIFMIDRIGLPIFLLFSALIFSLTRTRHSLILFVYLALSKVMFYSSAGIFIMFCISLSSKRVKTATGDSKP